MSLDIFEIHILYFVEVNIGEIMDVMQDLSNLKLAIQSNNKEHVENIYELYKQEEPSFLHKFSSEQLKRLEMDTMASVLIPIDLPLRLHEVFAVKSLGNGNCLFNSVSFLLCHSYRLSSVLRLLTAAELFVNANQYARHPKLQFPYDCPEITYDSKNLFAILLREEASIISDPIKAVIKEAAVTCNDKKWSGMFDILGLASVLKKNIWSVYPDCNDNIRPLISGVVEPLICSTIYHLTWRIPCLFCGLEMEILTVPLGNPLSQTTLCL